MRRRVFVYFSLFFLGASLFGGSVFTTYSQFVSEGPSPYRQEVVIPKGASLKKVSALLKQRNLIHSISIFELGVRASGNAEKLQAGEFSFPPYASAKLIMNILTDGTTYIRKVVIPEGWTSWEIVQYLNKVSSLEGEILTIPPEGTLLPETYHYSFGDPRQSILDRMAQAMTRVVNATWEERDSNLPFKTPEEAVILASLIEKETSIDAERVLVASVFVNRLNKRMRLQTDPTVIYALTKGKGKLTRRLTYADLRKNDPYNTYVQFGLPPGPIANPGAKSLWAAVHPKKTDYYYFVANGTGGHTFSKTYAQHQQKVSDWRQLTNGKKQERTVDEVSSTPANKVIETPTTGEVMVAPATDETANKNTLDTKSATTGK